MTTLKKAIGIYLTSVSSPKLAGANITGCRGTTGSTAWQPASDFIYYSYPNNSPGAAITGKNLDGITFTTGGASQVINANLGKIDATGWLPINFASLSGGSPISKVPVDPVNTILDPANPASSDLVYRYVCSEKNLTFEMDATLESTAYTVTDNKIAKDGGDNDNYYEVGTDLALLNTESSVVSHGNQNFTTPGTTTFVVPTGITSITIDVRGPGGGGGGSGDTGSQPGAGGGGLTNGGAAGEISGGGHGTDSAIKRGTTILAEAAIGGGGNGGNSLDGSLGGTGGNTGNDVSTGLSLTIYGGGLRGGGGLGSWDSGHDGVNGDKVTGNLTVTPGESLTIIVGLHGSGGDSFDFQGSPGNDGSISVSW